jgi:hypothetical protein
MFRYVSLLSIAISAGCGAGDALTWEEARVAVEQAAISGEGEAMVSEVIEISTDFTLGEAAQAAAAELAAWLESQIACSQVAVDGATITIDFGTLDDACVYNGHTYAGVAAVTIDSAAEGAVQVTHEWTQLTNGTITLDGGAIVTWTGEEDGLGRHVEHDLTWTRDDGTLVAATGDRQQVLLQYEEGLGFGLRIDGHRDWTYDDQQWQLDIDGVEMWGLDPVPHEGTYSLTNPDGKEVSLTFVRLDDDTIEVTLSGLRRDFVFNVSRAGDVEE